MPLNSAEEDAVRAYTGTLSNKINGMLRSASSLGDLAKTVNHLDAALAKSALSEELVVYRGVDEAFAHELESRGLREGVIITDSGFLSTSTRKDIAAGFLGQEGGGMLLKIRIRVGSKALRARPYSESPGEDEILLSRDAELCVVGYDVGTDVLELELK